MELTIALAISIISVVITVINFALNRKDKAIQNTKENNLELINFRLDQLDKNVQKILNRLDQYDEQALKIVQEEIEKHVLKYHQK